MVLDYRERKPVNKNRPKKGGGGGLLVLVAFTALGVVFALGFVAGWFAAKGRQRPVVERPATSDQERKDAAAAARTQAQTTGTAGGVDPPLTFYSTLPKGSRAVIGSGLNPSKSAEKAPAHPSTTPPAAATGGAPPATVAAPPQPARAPVPAVKAETLVPKPAEQKTAADKERKESASGGKYTVQLASYREKGEAEALRDRLAARGIAAFIQETRVSDRGVWYRLRVGRGLTQQQASEIAAKLGKEALVVPE
jgi:cell division protein FtsN